MNLGYKLLTAAYLTIAIAIPGFADGTLPPPSEGSDGAEPGTVPDKVQFLSFAAFDTDKDGYLSREEAKEIISETDFAVADVNGDGRLDTVEFAMEPKQLATDTKSEQEQRD